LERKISFSPDSISKSIYMNKKVTYEKLNSINQIALLAADYEPCTFRGTTRVELMKAEITNNKLSYSINGHSELWPGVSNYVLQVLSSDGTKPALLMYFFDSGGGSYPEVISYAQAQWFKQQSQLLNPNLK
jgi:hypothetical protein